MRVLRTVLLDDASSTAADSSRMLCRATHNHRLTRAGSRIGTMTFLRVMRNEAPQV